MSHTDQAGQADPTGIAEPAARSESLPLGRRRGRPPGQCRITDRTVEECRRLVFAANQAASRCLEHAAPTPASPPISIERWPQAVPSIVESVFAFMPTAILLRKVPWRQRPLIVDDVDHCTPHRFLPTIYICERIREVPSGRIKLVASRTLFLPLALPAETQTRGDMLAALGKGVPVRPQDGYRDRLLTGQLTLQEVARLHRSSPADQLAAITLLAAREGPAAFLSKDGSWPSSMLVWGIAERLEKKIVRLNFDGVPDRVIRQLRYARYEAIRS